MVVEARNHVVIGRAMEDFADLLQKALSVELGCGHESVLLQEDVLATKGRIEAIIVKVKSNLLVGQNVEWLFFSSVEDDFDGILQVDAHLVALEVLLRFHGEPILS